LHDFKRVHAYKIIYIQQILLVATKTIENVLINHDMKKQACETDVNDDSKNKETYLQHEKNLLKHTRRIIVMDYQCVHNKTMKLEL
jgi:hypothetical protein